MTVTEIFDQVSISIEILPDSNGANFVGYWCPKEKLNEKMSDENLKDEGLYDVVRNGITDNVNSSLFKEHIEDKISSMICPIVSDLSSNLDTNFEMMKKRILDF